MGQKKKKSRTLFSLLKKEKTRGVLTHPTLLRVNKLLQYALQKVSHVAHHCDMMCSGAHSENYRGAVEQSHAKCIMIKPMFFTAQS
jgi:alkaline phosphatase